jgi:Flp pilus assembly protein TadD
MSKGKQELARALLAQAVQALRAGRPDIARARAAEAIQADPKAGEARHLIGVVALRTGQPQAAVEALSRAAALRPRDPGPHADLGAALLMIGAAARAVEPLSRAAALAPASPDVQFNLGYAHGQIGRHDLAEAAYRKVLALGGESVDVLNNLAASLQAQGKAEEAIATYRKALDRPDAGPDVLANLALSLETLNELDGAADAVRRLLSLSPGHPRGRLMEATLLRRRGDLEAALDRLDALKASADPAILADVEAERGLVLDRLNRVDEAFAAFSAGKAAKRARGAAQGLDPARPRRAAEALGRWFTRERAAAWATPAPEGRAAPIFFVGFPRSGTTLMEEMLGAHPALATTGERSPLEAVLGPYRRGRDGIAYPEVLDTLDAPALAAMRAAFWQHADQATGAPDRRLLDKLPLNLIELGPIQRLFPEARIIVALRDPRDVVLSCFMQDFQLNDAMANFLDLGDAARLYDAVMSLWRHYRGTISLAWHQYRYEDLVDDPGAVTRGVFQFLDLPWDPAVLDWRSRQTGRFIATPSRHAVTEPLNRRAIGRWRRYARQMAPVLPLLAPYVAEYGYDAD